MDAGTREQDMLLASYDVPTDDHVALVGGHGTPSGLVQRTPLRQDSREIHHACQD